MHYFYHSIRLNTKFNINKQIQVPVNGSGRVSSNYIATFVSNLGHIALPLPYHSLLLYHLYIPSIQPSTFTNCYNSGQKHTNICTLCHFYISLWSERTLKPHKRVVSLFYTYLYIAFAICS